MWRLSWPWANVCIPRLLQIDPKDLTRCLYSSATDLDAYQTDKKKYRKNLGAGLLNARGFIECVMSYVDVLSNSTTEATSPHVASQRSAAPSSSSSPTPTVFGGTRPSPTPSMSPYVIEERHDENVLDTIDETMLHVHITLFGLSKALDAEDVNYFIHAMEMMTSQYFSGVDSDDQVQQQEEQQLMDQKRKVLSRGKPVSPSTRQSTENSVDHSSINHDNTEIIQSGEIHAGVTTIRFEGQHLTIDDNDGDDAGATGELQLRYQQRFVFQKPLQSRWSAWDVIVAPFTDSSTVDQFPAELKARYPDQFDNLIRVSVPTYTDADSDKWDGPAVATSDEHMSKTYFYTDNYPAQPGHSSSGLASLSLCLRSLGVPFLAFMSMASFLFHS
ncbi:hypothetical protein ACA910_021169 [Epithemia clementina (nom. ined.)]